ncbi:hypothetical protein PWY87_00870 [Kribbella solani]|uniref:hypothetical protein n=1 Tax=Kribbella solani TaxID=236067 RepID=UPI0029AFCEF0|nr:hypothetical protein [Kribbella solani]MDX3000202.1 hypothetical protein [Kribbella solani]
MMRDNGLTAASYTSLGGIDPLVAEPVLDALAAAGIAAYCENQSEARTPEEAAEPTVRIPVGYEVIYVDAEAVEQARPVIDRSTEDAEWKSLVEQFNQPSAPGHDGAEDPVPRWPVSEDVDDKYEPLIDVPAGLAIETPADDEDEEPVKKPADDPHDHFVPPEPPRGPRLDWISRAAWLGLLGGPLLLIVAALFDFGTGRITTLAVAGFIGGFLTLVLRMKDRLPPGSGGDDGAVV